MVAHHYTEAHPISGEYTASTSTFDDEPTTQTYAGNNIQIVGTADSGEHAARVRFLVTAIESVYNIPIKEAFTEVAEALSDLGEYCATVSFYEVRKALEILKLKDPPKPWPVVKEIKLTKPVDPVIKTRRESRRMFSVSGYLPARIKRKRKL